MAEETYGPQDHAEEAVVTEPSVAPDTDTNDIHDDPAPAADTGGEDADGDSGVPAGGSSPRSGDGGAAATPDGPEDAEGYRQEPAAGGSRVTASSNPAEGSPVGAGRLIANEQNARIIGMLRAFLTDGSMIELPMDGDAALRVIASWRSGSTLWGEVADPVSSPADASWAALDLDAVVGLLWMPGLPRQQPPRRITVDPAAA